jgi:hypothetical protein
MLLIDQNYLKINIPHNNINDDTCQRRCLVKDAETLKRVAVVAMTCIVGLSSFLSLKWCLILAPIFYLSLESHRALRNYQELMRSRKSGHTYEMFTFDDTPVLRWIFTRNHSCYGAENHLRFRRDLIDKKEIKQRTVLVLKNHQMSLTRKIVMVSIVVLATLLPTKAAFVLLPLFYSNVEDLAILRNRQELLRTRANFDPQLDPAAFNDSPIWRFSLSLNNP